MSKLTENNVRKHGGLTLAQQEEALLEKMQTLSNLLGQVDGMLEECPSTRPPTGASSRPPTNASRPPTGRGLTPGTAGPIGTAESTGVVRTGGSQPGSAASRLSTASGRPVSLRGMPLEPVQMAVIHESDRPIHEPKVELVTYTGTQGGHMISQGRRKVARLD